MSSAFSFYLVASNPSALTVPSGDRLHTMLRSPELPAATPSATSYFRLRVVAPPGVVLSEPLTPATLTGGHGFSESE